MANETKTIAYCMKCKAKREMQNPEKVIMKNGRPAMKGVCPECGTKMFRIMPKEGTALPKEEKESVWR